MELNADFEKIAVVRPDDYKWVPSPKAGVDRMMLDRIGDEISRATTIVKFAPNSEFTVHDHCGGEEFFVLEGVFLMSMPIIRRGATSETPLEHFIHQK